MAVTEGWWEQEGGREQEFQMMAARGQIRGRGQIRAARARWGWGKMVGWHWGWDTRQGMGYQTQVGF